MFDLFRLVELRKDNEIMQTSIADLLNIDQGLYSKYENLEKIIPIKHLNTLATFFNVNIDYLLNLTDIKTYINVNNDINKTLVGQRLKEFRKDNNLTQDKLAKILNTTHSTLSAYESGKTLIITPFIYTICNKYHISADYLLGKVDSPKYLEQ